MEVYRDIYRKFINVDTFVYKNVLSNIHVECVKHSMHLIGKFPKLTGLEKYQQSRCV